MLDKIIALILFVISFAALICIHEAGHLSMAKLFKVYCKEYSIGFGPAIYSKKKDGKETKFSIRCVPLGGYVSMYGEEGQDEDPEFKDLPIERSLAGVAKWKKAIIVAAGVVLNALLAFVLIFISNFAFKETYFTTRAIVDNTTLVEKGVTNGTEIKFIIPDSMMEDGIISPFTYEYTDSDKIIHAGTFYIVDTDVSIDGDEAKYVLAFLFNTNKTEPIFTDGLMVFKAIEKSHISEYAQTNKLFADWAKEENSPDYFPYIENGLVTFDHDVIIPADVMFEGLESPVHHDFKVVATKKAQKYINAFENDFGLSFEIDKVGLKWSNAGQRFKQTFVDFGDASIAVFKGLKVLFTGGIKNMSGVVGIFDTSSTLYSNYGFSTYLYFWGLISVNLAIFNLLPFPGLDGWQLLVTAIEGITRKKLPNKFKAIMSIVGLALLFALMIAILIIDIGRIIGF